MGIDVAAIIENDVEAAKFLGDRGEKRRVVLAADPMAASTGETTLSLRQHWH